MFIIANANEYFLFKVFLFLSYTPEKIKFPRQILNETTTKVDLPHRFCTVFYFFFITY